MLIVVLLWTVIGFSIAYYVAHRIIRHDEKQKMMKQVYTVRGHILKSTLDTKRKTCIDHVGGSITSSGEYITHYSYGAYDAMTGFALHFHEGFSLYDKLHGKRFSEDGPVTVFHSLSKEQADPFLQYTGDIYKHDGTLSYVIDKNGVKYFLSFTPDAH